MRLEKLSAGFVILIAALLLSACGSPTPPRRLTVFAAASLTESFTELSNRFEQRYQDVSVALNFAGSQQLLAELKLGARADLFAAASTRELQVAREQHLLGADSTVFARNSLVIVVPNGNPASISDPMAIGKRGLRVAIADTVVPAGAYTRDVLVKLALSPLAGPNFVERVLHNVVSQEHDVKHVVAKVLLGEVDAGIVYVTDAQAAGLPTISIPAEYNEEAVYEIALLEGTRDGLAKEFVALLLSAEGQLVFQKYGFRGAGIHQVGR